MYIYLYMYKENTSPSFLNDHFEESDFPKRSSLYVRGWMEEMELRPYKDEEVTKISVVGGSLAR